MGIFKRLKSLVKSNANDLIERAEDPEKLLNQTIVEMGHQLTEAKKSVADAIAEERRLRKQWETELEKSKGWKEKATLAVRHGDDGLAKEALARKREHEDLAEQYQKQWEAQQGAVDGLKGALRALNAKVEDAKRKKNLLVAKKRRADAQRQMHETVAGLGDESAFETFARMEKKIEHSEAEAESVAELNAEKTGDDVAQRLDELAAAAGGDMELLALKEELGLLGGRTAESEGEAPRLAAKKPAATAKSRLS
jgi:phage shock protein A